MSEKAASSTSTTKSAGVKKTSTRIVKIPRVTKQYFNRELSWLAFNRRVLEQAYNENYPLLERMRYLCFVNSNMDEFFEIRVAGVLQQVEAGIQSSGFDGLKPHEILKQIQKLVTLLVDDTYRCWRETLVPALKAERIHFKELHELTQKETRYIEKYFEDDVYPVLTPLAIDPSHPFPQIANKSLNILVWIEDASAPDEHHMAIVPVPRILPRVIPIEGNKNKEVYIFLSDVIERSVHTLFPGYTVKGAWAFRITRNSDLYIDEEEAENLLEKIEDELSKMRKGDAVRLEIQAGVDERLLQGLLKAIDLSIDNTYIIDGPINLLRLNSVYDLIGRDDLKFPPFTPFIPQKLKEDSIFSQLRKEDIFLHHPYESFTPVVDFIEKAAKDPKVFAIKQTLYRTSGDSPIVEALMKASELGKQVTVLVELKARFDEMNNIQWARRMEEVGVHVVYGMLGLKTHCKCCLVVRRESKGLRRYGHLGTGNYNPKTAKLYTDCSFMTSREEITSEMADLFNTLTGFSKTPQFKKLLVAPFNLHKKMQVLIKNETANAKKGKSARIIAKCNSLVDQETIDNLYEASQAGVQIDLIIRGVCCLVPGVKGLSENIKVRSILGRFLEHSRIYYFKNTGGVPHIYAGSADWMQRNFFRRIEAVFPIEDKQLRRRILDILKVTLADNQLSKSLRANGTYLKASLGKNRPKVDSQIEFMLEAENKRTATEVFEEQQETFVE